jgi:nitric oxide reductase NorD protein
VDKKELQARLAEALLPDVINDWQVEEMTEPLLALPDSALRDVLGQTRVIWPVSHALCINFLNQVPRALDCLSLSQLPGWVKTVLARYEAGGLRQAQAALEKVEENFLCRLRGQSGFRFNEMAGVLQPYATGLAGRAMELAVAEEVSTDTATIFLPAEISLFPEQAENFLFYKLAVSYQWAYTAMGTLAAALPAGSPLLRAIAARYGTAFPAEDHSWLAGFFQLFPQASFAGRLFHLAETARATAFLWQRLPGLMRESAPLCQRMAHTLPRNSSLAGLQAALLNHHPESTPPTRCVRTGEPAMDRFRSLFRGKKSDDSLRFVADFYDSLVAEQKDEPLPLFFQGVLRPTEAHAVRLQRREETRHRFVEALAALIQTTKRKNDRETDGGPEQQAAILPDSDGQAQLILPGAAGKEKIPPEPAQDQTSNFITLDDQRLQLPEELRKTAREILADLGHLPSHYIASATGLSGKAAARGSSPSPESGEGEEPRAGGVTIYDEWDYRRMDFRKNWCFLSHKEITAVKGTFVGDTLKKYRNHLVRLRQQFEMMRSQERFVRRQKDGNDIDLDALTESLADLRAGLAPAEGLYIRLARDERSIAALFLVDMSSSTEGWVNAAIKESLILLCEALETLGDSYGIYGFSGMRRLRCELFRIKHLTEPYNAEVKGRIAAITPQDYTRMGPPIRHLTRLLEKSEAKIRLLITLSDGKPEDYDDYKGDYAIEDTRHALIEARARGIHPFCITIDKQAHEYLPHMCGKGNYIVIDEAGKLPSRIPEIYRNLTG